MGKIEKEEKEKIDILNPPMEMNPPKREKDPEPPPPFSYSRASSIQAEEFLIALKFVFIRFTSAAAFVYQVVGLPTPPVELKNLHLTSGKEYTSYY